MLEVEVRGDTFHSKESRKVLVKRFKPASFIQTDKPIYIPGQTGKLIPGWTPAIICCGAASDVLVIPVGPVSFRVISLDSMLRPAALLVSPEPSQGFIGIAQMFKALVRYYEVTA